MKKSELGFACGKTCPNCSQPVSLDAQGRYTCFTDGPGCGGFVKLDDISTANYGKMNARQESRSRGESRDEE